MIDVQCLLLSRLVWDGGEVLTLFIHSLSSFPLPSLAWSPPGLLWIEFRVSVTLNLKLGPELGVPRPVICGGSAVREGSQRDRMMERSRVGRVSPGDLDRPRAVVANLWYGGCSGLFESLKALKGLPSLASGPGGSGAGAVPCGWSGCSWERGTGQFQQGFVGLPEWGRDTFIQ